MVLDDISPIRKILKFDKLSIDNAIFRLHYKATIIFLLLSSLLVTSTQYFGDPIQCIKTHDVDESLLNTYCWIHSVFILPNSLNKTVGEEVPYPGIAKYSSGEPKKFQNYYQWVFLMLFVQSLFFYIPRYLWKLWEGERVKSLVLTLNKPVLTESTRKDELVLLVSYLKDNIRYHNPYFYYFVVCETLNLVNVIVQIFVVDAFLGGTFTTYGSEVVEFSEAEDQWSRVDPMVRVFPRMGKCNFWRYGPSGDVQKHDTLCLLPLNILNEKVYIFIWFWFIILAALSGLMLIYRIILILFPRLRYLLLRSRARLTDRVHLQIVMEAAKIGDWFLLYLLSKNVDPFNFKDLMQELHKELVDDESGNDLVNSKQQY